MRLQRIRRSRICTAFAAVQIHEPRVLMLMSECRNRWMVQLRQTADLPFTHFFFFWFYLRTKTGQSPITLYKLPIQRPELFRHYYRTRPSRLCSQQLASKQVPLPNTTLRCELTNGSMCWSVQCPAIQPSSESPCPSTGDFQETFFILLSKW